MPGFGSGNFEERFLHVPAKVHAFSRLRFRDVGSARVEAGRVSSSCLALAGQEFDDGYHHEAVQASASFARAKDEVGVQNTVSQSGRQ